MIKIILCRIPGIYDVRHEPETPGNRQQTKREKEQKRHMEMQKTREPMRYQNNQIDLLELFHALRKRALFLIIAAVAGAILALAYTQLLLTPMYSATATMLVLTKETTLTSLADLQLGSQLTNDYSRLVLSHSVLKEVIDNLGLDMDYHALKGCVTTNNPADTRIMEITVTNPNPETAKALAEELGEVSAQFIGEQMEIVPPKIIEDVELPTAPVSPSLSKNVMMGALLGVVLVAGVICAMTLLDDSIKTESDIVQVLGIPALASIPDRRDYINGSGESAQKVKKKKRRRHHR